MSVSAETAGAVRVAQPALPRVELAARVVLLACFAAALYACWTPAAAAAAAWADRVARAGTALGVSSLAAERLLRIFPRMAVLTLSALLALILHGGRPSERFLLWTGALLTLCNFALHPLAGTEFQGQFVRVAPLQSGLLELLHFEVALLGAIFLGLWAGRGIQTPFHFLAVLLCAIAGDVWLSGFRVLETAGPESLLGALRLPWPAAQARFALTPEFMDIVVLSAVCGALGRLRLHAWAVLVGALSGYCGAAFLSLEPWLNMAVIPPMGVVVNACALGMLMSACGTLLGAWPDLRCRLSDVVRAFLLSLALLAVLAGCLGLRHFLQGPPPAPEPPPPARNVAFAEYSSGLQA